MLGQHPESAKIQKQLFDFNSELNCADFTENKYDLLLSSSALQWCNNLGNTLAHLSLSSKYIIASLFTNNTFKTIHRIARINSPIQSSDEFIKAFDRYYDATYELRSYKLHFKTKEEMFKYIKHSGVSGGKHQMNYKETKSLIMNYPYDYLEFEVLFVSGKSINF
jgi:malonyl-CoA O-methyltransferase